MAAAARQATASAVSLLATVCTTSAGADFVMRAPEDPGGTPEIVGGRPAVPNEWKASFRYTHNGTACSATAIGARTILTAAHCVDARTTGSVQTDSFSAKVVDCRRHPLWSSVDDIAHDIALCLTDKIMWLGQDVGYERVNRDINAAKPGGSVTLQGYGCRQPDGLGPTGVLWLGPATIRMSSPPQDYIVTSGGAAVCSGDSGGAVFMDIDQYRRLVIGVNAHGLMSTLSYITDVFSQSVRNQLIDPWTEKTGTICGINEPVGNCHD